MARNGAVRKPPCATEQERHRKQKAPRARVCRRGANARLLCGDIGARPDQKLCGAPSLFLGDNRPAHWDSARGERARAFGVGDWRACRQNSAMSFAVPTPKQERAARKPPSDAPRDRAQWTGLLVGYVRNDVEQLASGPLPAPAEQGAVAVAELSRKRPVCRPSNDVRLKRPALTQPVSRLGCGSYPRPPRSQAP
jgi:hypothetical protein